MEIRDAAGASLLLIGADWTDTGRGLATLGSIWDVWQARGDHGAMSKQRSRPETSSIAHLRSCYEKLDCANLAGLPVSVGSRNWWINELENCHFCCIDGEGTSKLGIETS